VVNNYTAKMDTLRVAAVIKTMVVVAKTTIAISKENLLSVKYGRYFRVKLLRVNGKNSWTGKL
jgi:hypothetical protein